MFLDFDCYKIVIQEKVFHFRRHYIEVFKSKGVLSGFQITYMEKAYLSLKAAKHLEKMYGVST